MASREELEALEKFAFARQARLNRIQESDLGLQYQVLNIGTRHTDRMVAHARKVMLLQDEGKRLEDLSLLDPYAKSPLDEAYDLSFSLHPSFDRGAARIPGITCDTGASFRWNQKRLERGWRGSPSCTAPRQLTYSTATNRVVQKEMPQLIPGLIGTPAAYEHKTPPAAAVAGGLDFSLEEFINCIRTGKGGLGAIEPALGNSSKLKSLSDAALTKVFYRIDEDRSNSLSFDEFYYALDQWEDDRKAARDRQRRLRESVCWRGGIKKSTFLAKVKDAAKIGAFGRVMARGAPLSKHSVSDLSSLFDEIDEDGNGDLTSQEFLGGLEAIDAERNHGKRARGASSPARLKRLEAPSSFLALGGGPIATPEGRPSAGGAAALASLRDSLGALPGAHPRPASSQARAPRALKSCFVR